MQPVISQLDVRPVLGDVEWQHVVRIREQVFIREQACPPDEEWDEYEERSRHLLGYFEGRPVATSRWRASTHDERIVAKLERFAVLEAYRGRGFGRKMVEATMDDARSAGFTSFILHAQQHLEHFYGAFGFVTCGETFYEANIPHIPMVRWAE